LDSISDSFVVDRSLIVLPRGEGLLSVRMLDAYNRPRDSMVQVKDFARRTGSNSVL
jgi:hypothetical protein